MELPEYFSNLVPEVQIKFLEIKKAEEETKRALDLSKEETKRALDLSKEETKRVEAGKEVAWITSSATQEEKYKM